MNRHLLWIALTSVTALALGASPGAQPSRRVPSTLERAKADQSGARPQAFSVSLVLGEMQTSAGSDTVPAAARKALTDVKDFLPYKTYRLLDTQWTLCCGRSAIVTRLRGPEEQDYGLELAPSNAGNGKWYVHFSLWEPRASSEAAASSAGSVTAASGGRSLAAVEDKRLQLEQQLAAMRKTLNENHPEVAHTKMTIEMLEGQLTAMRSTEATRRTSAAPRRPVIDTSFTMDVGETVVVGTSRLKGDKALIALLTAVAPTKSPAK